MRNAELVYLVLDEASKNGGKLEKPNYTPVIDTEHLQIIIQKEKDYWLVNLYPKDEIGVLIQTAYEKLKKSEALTRDFLLYALHFIINNS